jgi:hypothetical protein
MKILKAGVVGGLIVWVWYALSWMALPWHQTTIEHFKDETAVAKVITENAPISGIYLMPTVHNAETAKNPMVFASVYLPGMPVSMAQAIGVSVVKDIIVALLVAWMLMQAAYTGYIGRVLFVVVFALAAAISSQVAFWNWWKFDMNFVLVGMADLVISWFCAGLVMAKICKH